MVYGLRMPHYLRVINWTTLYHSDSLKVLMIMFYLNMVGYPMSFISLYAVKLFHSLGFLTRGRLLAEKW